ncbi:MAG: hypothetical protein QXP70_03765, partial [Methanomassiliicoccales archaeon]
DGGIAYITDMLYLIGIGAVTLLVSFVFTGILSRYGGAASRMAYALLALELLLIPPLGVILKW